VAGSLEPTVPTLEQAHAIAGDITLVVPTETPEDETPEDEVDETPEVGAETPEVEVDETPEVRTAPSEYEKQLRTENAEYRKAWQPFEEAFGEISEDDRAKFLSSGTVVGKDLIDVAAALGGLDEDDREYVATTLALIGTDPQSAANHFASIAAVLRKGYGTEDYLPADIDEVTYPEFDDIDELDEPVTRRDMQRMMQQSQHDAEVGRQSAAILAEAKGLGYDPESRDPVKRAEAQILYQIAADHTGTDLVKAHAILQKRDQDIIDAYVAGKAADADSPSPLIPGSAPSNGKPRAQTIEEAHRRFDAEMDQLTNPNILR
jgi:hypothetical protein